MAILQANRISKHFDGLVAVNKVSFVLNPGEILGLIGPNGAGKTTVVNMIAGVYPPTEGEIHFKGKPIHGLKPYRIGRMGIARTFQVVKPFPGMTVKENVAVGAMFGARGKRRSAKEAMEKAEEVLEFVGLADQKDRRADQLGVAFRKRLEMAKALAMSPDVVLFDEVMAGLNFGEIDQAVQMIQKIRHSGITILVIEHVMRAIKNLCDRVFVLHHGEKIADGPVEEVLNDENVIKAYLGKRFKELTH
ncbi:amino acid/amide ABC transporter ATP-binding protein 1, HAAT family (TC 3.A.1.4.-) [Desulfacinum hydrothermale DSM 13146]|uniref:Amino acid/amide ABC transporter ATP-binding protein 1, HAAT family (TC 3.A.1.4.-) n=1 Tax=Desulfacinum hydrothermale DSM 13146 TaxID=1121390 RepID=A0A1W1XJ71_9BACT|nr:ABC transporter ATP-binding protein [Desulfacinum hydrothermale]SMC24030.1 amino acid/amide ABC transporter ATP-binding protein 1, HAAT family (TC 3.A.1.4.-) [Desulfacinum hydrothermale DSM 13146]